MTSLSLIGGGAATAMPNLLTPAWIRRLPPAALAWASQKNSYDTSDQLLSVRRDHALEDHRKVETEAADDKGHCGLKLDVGIDQVVLANGRGEKDGERRPTDDLDHHAAS
jgi:hypothetical protein